MTGEKISIEKIEQNLNDLGKLSYQMLVQKVQDKKEFFKNFLNQIEVKDVFQSSKDIDFYMRPVSSLWEQWLVGIHPYRKIAFSLMFLIFFLSIFSFVYFYSGSHSNTKIQSVEEELNKRFEKMGINKPVTRDDKWESEMLRKIQEQEDIEKKKVYIQELIDYYRRTNQQDKLNDFLKEID